MHTAIIVSLKKPCKWISSKLSKLPSKKRISYKSVKVFANLVGQEVYKYVSKCVGR